MSLQTLHQKPCRQFYCFFLSMLLTLIITPSYANNFWPSKAEWQQSFVDAAKSPLTWVPLLGAAGVALTNSDNRISNWAGSHTPIYGSHKNAGEWSTNLERGLVVVAVGSFFLMPQFTDETWTQEKEKYFLAMVGAYGTAVGTTGILKITVNRPRPTGRDNRSFPSGHMTSAFSSAALTSRNLDMYPISPPAAFLAKSSLYLVALGIGWGRIESRAHYPTDVLVGAAIGNFFTSAIYNAFLNTPTRTRPTVAVIPVDKGFAVSVSKEF